jgi:hypothetical protein
MVKLMIEWAEEPAENTCELCSLAIAQSAGARLCLVESMAAVCRTCARKHAPALCALLDIACLAQHVGRVSRHAVLGVPIGPLLELTRAAEAYYSCIAPLEGRKT